MAPQRFNPEDRHGKQYGPEGENRKRKIKSLTAEQNQSQCFCHRQRQQNPDACESVDGGLHFAPVTFVRVTFVGVPFARVSGDAASASSARSTTAMRMETPFVTCSRITDCLPSATPAVTSRPRMMGPG